MAVRTRRVPLAGSDKAATLAQQIGRPPTDESISATVHLRQLGDSLEPFVERLAEQDLHTRRYLTRTELAQRHGADANDIANVRTFARRHHLHVARIDVARRTVELTGTVHDMEAAFGTSLSLHADERGVFRARSGPLTVPAYLEPVIVAVLGLDNRPAAHAHFRFGRLEADGGTLARAGPAAATASPRTSWRPSTTSRPTCRGRARRSRSSSWAAGSERTSSTATSPSSASCRRR